MRVLVTGASGKLGAHLVKELAARGHSVVAWSRRREGSVEGVPLRRVNLGDLDSIELALKQDRPQACLHSAALSAISDCHAQPELADLVNRQATVWLAQRVERLVYVSTDLVFDGTLAPYTEQAVPRPISVYGRSKLAAELAAREFPGVTVARVSLLYGPSLFDGGFFAQQMEALQQGRPLKLFTDEWRTPLALDDAAVGLAELMERSYLKLVHLGGPERLSRFEMGYLMAKQLGCPTDLVLPVKQEDVNFPEPRPSDVSLVSERATIEWGWSPSAYAVGLTRLIGNLPPFSIKG